MKGEGEGYREHQGAKGVAERWRVLITTWPFVVQLEPSNWRLVEARG